MINLKKRKIDWKTLIEIVGYFLSSIVLIIFMYFFWVMFIGGILYEYATTSVDTSNTQEINETTNY